MLKNILIIGLRSFLNQRLYSILNVFGLTLGLTCTLLIYLWVKDELAINMFHSNIDKIFKVSSNIKQANGEVVTWPTVPGPMADEILENDSEVELAARTYDNGKQLFKYHNDAFLESGIYADPSFVKVFDFKVLEGSLPPQTIEKNWLVISKQLALKLFGEEDGLGKSVDVGGTELTVTAIVENWDNRSSIRFEFLVPFEIIREKQGDGFNWDNFDYELYLKLHNKSNVLGVAQRINDRYNDKLPDEYKNSNGFYVQPFKDVYLYSGFENGHPISGRIKYIEAFSITAILILVIACINFMNMATARAATRAKEVGIRKVAGAQKGSLISQFLLESTVVSALSTLLALLIVALVLPVFNELVSKSISLDFNDPVLLITIAIIILITGLLAGSYPAFFLSAFKPVTVLKGGMVSKPGGNGLRQALIVFQVTPTVVLIISAFVIYKQTSFINKANLGYDRENILSFSARDAGSQFATFRDEVQHIKGIVNVSRSSQSLIEVNNQTSSVHWPGEPNNSLQNFRAINVDIGFIETMGLELKQGRTFSLAYNDTSNFVISQKAVEVMGLTNPIGQRISLWGKEGTIVGVVNDFHSRSMHEVVDPIILHYYPQWTSRVFVRFEAAEVSSVIQMLQEVYKLYSAGYPFEYSFLDEDFERLYSNERTASQLIYLFTGITIIISGLGLFGLAAFSAERRKKEIAIRKTLGASVYEIITMMSKDFTKLGIIALGIGSPIGFYLMDSFLQSYAYRTPMTPSIFLATSLIILIFTLSVIVFQVTKLALTNPVYSLRSE